MTQGTQTTAAAIYCRISLDADGDELGVRRQEEDCRALAATLGMEVAEVYIDNDMGASNRSRAKRRPAYERMLDDARAGRVGALLAYSNSRLTRRPLELEGLITLHEQHGTIIDTVVSGKDDLSTADGRMVARIKASVDAAEAERISERVKRKHLENARAGRPVGGTRPFGWQADKVTIEPTEATLIRQAADDICRGIPLAHIVAAWNDAEVPTSRGADWSSQTVRQMLKSPRLAGYRVHQRAVALDAAGLPVRGQWQAILDEDQHRAVVARLSRVEGRSRIPRRGARHYLLTGLIRCGVCNGPMYGNRTPTGHSYACTMPGADHTNSISGPGADDVAALLALGRLAEVELDDVAPPAKGDRGDAALEQIATKIDELMGAFTAGTLTAAIVFPAVERLETERDELRGDMAQTALERSRPRVSRLTEGEWDALSVHERRELLETLLDAFLVRPTTRRGNTFDGTRVVPVWRATGDRA